MQEFKAYSSSVMIRHTKIKNHPGLVRDTKTKAIVNVDSTAFEIYKSERNFRKEIKEKTYEAEQDINTIKNDLNEIKTILLQLLQKNR